MPEHTKSTYRKSALYGFTVCTSQAAFSPLVWVHRPSSFLHQQTGCYRHLNVLPAAKHLLYGPLLCWTALNKCCNHLSYLSHYFASKIVPNHCCMDYTEFQTSFGDVRSLTISAGAPFFWKKNVPFSRNSSPHFGLLLSLILMLNLLLSLAQVLHTLLTKLLSWKSIPLQEISLENVCQNEISCTLFTLLGLFSWLFTFNGRD